MSKENEKNKWQDTQLNLENLTDEKLDALLTENAEQEVSLLKRTLVNEEATSKIDIEKEWEKWEHSHADNYHAKADDNHANTVSHQRSYPWFKIAAAFLGLLMLSGISYAAYYAASRHADHQQMMAADSLQRDSSIHQKATVAQTWQKIEPTKNAPIVFEDAELATILNYIAEKTHVKVEYRNAAAAHIRFYLQWESKDTLGDIIEKINHFQKVHIEFDESAQRLMVE